MRFTNPSTLSKPTGYSHIVEVAHGRTLFISGQVPLDSAGNLIGRGDFAAQTEQVFKNLQAALESCGAGFQHVVKLTLFVTDISQVSVLREIRTRYVNSANPPASTLVQVKGLVREEFLVEIEAVAVVPE
jgi:reactive intermediate/imine deaminase